MKNKVGIIGGFILGAAGFLFLFKLLVLDRTNPADELAPGMVVIAALISGLACAFIVSKLQRYWAHKGN